MIRCNLQGRANKKCCGGEEAVMSLKLEIKGVVLNMCMPHKLDRSQKTKKNSGAIWMKWVESAPSFSYCSY